MKDDIAVADGPTTHRPTADNDNRRTFAIRNVRTGSAVRRPTHPVDDQETGWTDRWLHEHLVALGPPTRTCGLHGIRDDHTTKAGRPP